jgi:hypothetical protein
VINENNNQQEEVVNNRIIKVQEKLFASRKRDFCLKKNTFFHWKSILHQRKSSIPLLSEEKELDYLRKREFTFRTFSQWKNSYLKVLKKRLEDQEVISSQFFIKFL